MDTSLRQRALEETIRLAEAAFGTAGGSATVSPFTHGECCAEFLDVIYHKLCDLYEDACEK